jgi:transposase-like protein
MKNSAAHSSNSLMKPNKFVQWIRGVSGLNENQRQDCACQLNKDMAQDAPPAITDATADCCPHCDHVGLVKNGRASGLQRWKCKGCNRSFNILTKTPLAGLRHKEKWLENAKAMIAGKSVRDTAKDCDVHRNTAFRWRHRFSELPSLAQHTDLKGIAESDATYFYRSEKGSKDLKRKPRKRGGSGIGPGLSSDLVPVVTVRDRTGKGADRVAITNLRVHAHDLYHVHLSQDTLLITDGDTSLCAAARDRNPEAHLDLPGKESRGCGASPFHIQTTNSFHSNLKSWVRRFNGVATKYLQNYVGWHRHLFEGNHGKDPNTFISLSLNPLAVCPQLTMT